MAAEEIQLAALGAGHEVFFDEASLPPGSDYNSRIREAIEQSDAFIFLISPNSVGKGRYVHTELKLAKIKWPKPWGTVLPVMIAPTEYKLIDRYLTAITILEPLGNVAAEVAAALNTLSKQTRTVTRCMTNAEYLDLKTKYFIYVSHTKVAMLYSQIPATFLKRLSNWLTARLSDRLPTVEKHPCSQQIQAVCEYLRTNENVGTITSPGKYIAGCFPLRYGIVSEYASDIAFFGGTIGDKVRLGLIGSSASLVGATERVNANHAPYYYTLKFFNQLSASEGMEEQEPHNYSSAIDIALKTLPPQTYNLEFFAKVLHRENSLLVGTPIYVALDQ